MRIIFTLAACIMIGSACSSTDKSSAVADDPQLKLFASSTDLPYTDDYSIALTSEEMACIYDSYEYQVLCDSPEWNTNTVIGREGEGPGEFGSNVALVGGPSGTLGVVEMAAMRLSIFSADGTLLSTAPVPPLFLPVSRLSDTLAVGVFLDFANNQTTTLLRVDLLDGSWRSMRPIVPASEPRRDGFTGALTRTILSPDGGYLVNFYGGRFERFTEQGELVSHFSHPDGRVELPSDRDLEVYAAQFRALGGAEPSAVDFEKKARTPKNPILPEGLSFGPDRTLWVATTQDHDEFSYFDLFRDDNFIGSVRIRDRLVGFDIFGNTLAALVKDDERDLNGIYPLRIDWYRID